MILSFLIFVLILLWIFNNDGEPPTGSENDYCHS